MKIKCEYCDSMFDDILDRQAELCGKEDKITTEKTVSLLAN